MKACIPKLTAEKLKTQLENGEITPEKIADMLPEEKAALKSILEGVVSEKLGIKVSSEEVAKINDLSKKIDTAQQKLGEDFGNPAKTQENIDFMLSLKDMTDFIKSKNPMPVLKVATSTAGRAAMLFSPKSPILNVGSNIEAGFAEALSRRISSSQLRGANNKLAVDYVKMVNKIYQKTGYDISRMMSITDVGAIGERFLGQGMVHAQGPGNYRAIIRYVAEDFVFKQLMGAPDVAFSAAHFADSVNLASMKMAKGDKVAASEMMTDAMRLEPKTPEGIVLREQAILDAQTATWTNKTWASDLSQNLRKTFNTLTGDARLGDLMFPFVKTPANVIATGMDYAGLGVLKAMGDMYKAIKVKELGNKQVIQRISRNLVRSGLGITGAIMITSQLDDDDFVGAYDPARNQIEQLRNSNYNAIRIGGKWISTEWLGPLGVPVTAMMYSRKYGQKGWMERIYQYVAGVGSGGLNLPVVKEMIDIGKNVMYKKNQTVEEMAKGTSDWLSDFVYSRLIPSFFSDTAKVFDAKERLIGKGWISGIKSRIPGLRQTLPEKKNIFGETIIGEPAWSEIVFGSRLKTDKESGIIKELNQVSMNTGKGINFTNWDKSSSKMLAQFKEKKGQERFDEAKLEYGQRLKIKIEKEIQKQSYKKANDEDKLKILNNLDSETINEIFNRYNFKYKK